MAQSPTVPEGWEVKTLGEVCGFQGGNQPPKSTFINDSKEGYVRLLQIRDFKTDKFRVFIPESPKNRVCKKEDILIARYGASVGQIHTGKSGAYNVALMKTEPDLDKLNRYFFYHYLNSDLFQNPLKLAADRAAQNGFNKEEISQFSLPIPPLPEQERIVSVLDKAFEGIAEATAQAEKNLNNAKELFQSVLDKTFTEKGDDWEEFRLGELGQISSSKRIFKSEYKEKGIPFYRTKEIKELANGNAVSLELYISEDRYLEIRKKHGVPEIDDLLITAIGTIGEIYVVKSSEPFYFKDGNVLWLKEFSSVNSIFLKYILLAFVEDLRRLSRGAAYNALPIQKLKNHLVVLPSIPEQKEIVKKLDALSEETKRLELIYQKKLDALSELKQSLLKKAFAGEL